MRTPMRSAMIGRADFVAITMCERALDSIRAPFPAFVQQGAGHRAEAMRRHFIARKAQPPKPAVDGVFTHRAGARSDRGKDIASRSRDLINLPEQFD